MSWDYGIFVVPHLQVQQENFMDLIIIFANLVEMFTIKLEGKNIELWYLEIYLLDVVSD